MIHTGKKKKHFNFFFNLKINRGKKSQSQKEPGQQPASRGFLISEVGSHQVCPWQVLASIKGLLPGASAHEDEGALVSRCWDT